MIENVVAFIPFGFAFAFAPHLNRPRFKAAVFCAVLALCIELLQIFVPERFPQISDIACNSLGGWLGAWLWPLRIRTREYTKT